MSAEPGLHVLMQVGAAFFSAALTGPLGNIDIPEADLDRIAAMRTARSIEVIQEARHAEPLRLGWIAGPRPAKPEFPAHFQNAILAAEDVRFGQHPGVDPVALVAALLDSVTGRLRGGSGLAQQLIKNTVTGPARTFERKAIEAVLALRLTAAFPAPDILDSYLASAWFGRGLGAGAAAPTWLGKTWDQVQPHESAFLAGLLTAPASHDPQYHRDRARLRRNQVLQSMHNAGTLSATDLAAGQALPVDTELLASSRPPRWIASALDRLGSGDGADQVRVTIDADWQHIAQSALREHLFRIGGTGPAGNVAPVLLQDPDGETGLLRRAASRFLDISPGTARLIVTRTQGSEVSGLLDRGHGDMTQLVRNWTDTPLRPGDVLAVTADNETPELIPLPAFQGAVVIMTPDGELLAIVGGSDPDLLPLDRTRGRRAPGSALKPFLWTAALANGLSPHDLVPNVITSYQLTDGSEWTPRNFDLSETGPIPAWFALEISSNLAAARIAHATGLHALRRVTEHLGVYKTMPLHPATALGTHETDLLLLTSGYAAYANGGRAAQARIAAGDHPPRATNFRLEPWIVRDMASMLYGAAQRGTAAPAFAGSQLDVAGKTGTSSNHRDVWFLGWVPGIVIGVWLGHDDGRPLPPRMTGGTAAAPLARRILEKADSHGLLTTDADQSWPPPLFHAPR